MLKKKMSVISQKTHVILYAHYYYRRMMGRRVEINVMCHLKSSWYTTV